MDASLVPKSDTVHSAEQAQSTIEVPDILPHRTQLGLQLPLRRDTIGRFGSDIGNEGQDVGRGDEGGRAQEADELGLDERRRDQSGKIRHSGDTRDGEENALAGFRYWAVLLQWSQQAYFVFLVALIIFGSELGDEFLLL